MKHDHQGKARQATSGPNACPEHPSAFIREEMEARGWSRDRMAWEMCRGFKVDEHRLALDLYLDAGPSTPGMRVDAPRLAQAFGTSPALWSRLEQSWLAGRSA